MFKFLTVTLILAIFVTAASTYQISATRPNDKLVLLEISHPYPNVNNSNYWKFYYVTASETVAAKAAPSLDRSDLTPPHPPQPNVVVLPDQLRGICSVKNLDRCKISLKDIPVNAIISMFDGFEWYFNIGLTDAAEPATKYASVLAATNLWKEIYPPFIVINMPNDATHDKNCAYQG